MKHRKQNDSWKVLTAFAILYFVWGSTFFAIRIGVQEVPPLLFAAIRFLTAGVLLYGGMRLRGVKAPTRQQWFSVTCVAFLIFVGDYGLLFWAEKRVPSGLAAVMMATIPVFLALLEIVLLKTQRLTTRLAFALLIGIAGVAVLMSRTLHVSGAPIDAPGALALIVGAVFWSVASVLSRKLPFPESKALSSGAQMTAGGLLLFLAASAFGEWRDFDPRAVSGRAWVALVYLIVAGSLIGFTAYVWLLHRESPTKVGTYAYVNPVVAVVLGYFLGGEALGMRTVLGTLAVLVSVVIITTARSRLAPEPEAAEVDGATVPT